MVEGVPNANTTSVVRRFYRKPALIGGALAGLIFLAVLLGGHWTLLARDRIGGFYDLQAHSLLHGRWDVPAGPLGFEAFMIHGKAYTYYGPWPAILRLPVAVVTDGLDGRLTQLSMLLAFVVALVFTFRLLARVRSIIRPDDAVTTGERWVVGTFVFVVGAGSVIPFLASRAFVYHEAELWGAALAIGALEFVIAYTTTASRRHLMLASALAALAFLSRASVGAGPVAALGLLFLAGFWAPTRRLAGLSDEHRKHGEWLALGIAVAVPVALYAAVNYAKFGSLYALPLDRQVFTQFNPARKAALAANHNSLFGLKFVPSTLVQFLRPDAIRFTSLFPWVDFPPAAHVFGGVTFDTLDLSSSIPASMPALSALTVVGIVGTFRRKRNDRPSLAVLRAPLLGAALGTTITLTIAFIAHRYLSDFLPLLVVAAAAGLQVVLRWTFAEPRGRTAVRVAWAVLAVLAILSVWVNLGLAILYQRAVNPGTTESTRADFVELQYRVHRVFPGGSPPDVTHSAELPRQPAARGTVVVIGDCGGLYWSSGSRWFALERTRATGAWRMRARFPRRPTAQWQPLVTSGTPGKGNFVAARVRRDGRVVFGFLAQGIDQTWHESTPQSLPTDRPTVVDVADDSRSGQVEVRVDGRSVLSVSDLLLSGSSSIRPAVDATVGRNEIGGPVAARFAGAIHEVPIRPTRCRDLLG